MQNTNTTLPWIGLVGTAGAGKDTVANELVQMYGYTRVAFADPVRSALLAVDPLIARRRLGATRLSQAVETLGWEHAKRFYPEVRDLLQRLGTDAIRAQTPNYWCDLAERKAAAVDGTVVFTDVRFINEIKMIEGHNGVIVHVERKGNPVLQSTAAAHRSENEWKSWSPTLRLSNNGTMEELAHAIVTLTNNI